jgi:hypothetical protein
MNSELVNLLISLDKNAETLTSKNYSDGLLIDSHPGLKFHSKSQSKSILFTKNHNLIQHDRRDRRTLRAKINKILSALPDPCSKISKKHLRLMKSLKKKKLEEVNALRKKLGKEIISVDDFSLEDSFDQYGNVVEKNKYIHRNLTPETALREKLSKSELDMLKEDPVYFIQNQNYKYKIKLDDDESWEKLIDLQDKTHKKHNYNLEPKVSIRKPVSSKPESLKVLTKQSKISERIKNKLHKAIVQKEKFQRQISKKFEEKFRNYSQKTLNRGSKDNIRIYGEKNPSINHLDHNKNNSSKSHYEEKLYKVQEFLKKQKTIEDKINDFYNKVRDVEIIHSCKLKEQDLLSKVNSMKGKLKILSDRPFKHSFNTPKIIIKPSLNED